MLDNGSKPLHEACLLKAGFNVPPSLTSSDPVRLRAFAETHAAIVKSICGIRADCRRVDPQEFADFHPEQGPVHLQKAIDGIDVRVHVVQERAIAVGVRTAEVDYRIADDAEYFRFDLPSELARQVVESTRAMGLAFAGWDFKVDQDGKFYALEANPMPGYHPYDRAVDGAITRALLDHLEEPT
jgi:glutathione synthase/RimK-type ligase-like ATP-grasp enzyme